MYEQLGPPSGLECRPDDSSAGQLHLLLQYVHATRFPQKDSQQDCDGLIWHMPKGACRVEVSCCIGKSMIMNWGWCRMGLARLLLGLKLEELVLERCSDILQASAFVAVASLSNLKASLLFQKQHTSWLSSCPFQLSS